MRRRAHPLGDVMPAGLAAALALVFAAALTWGACASAEVGDPAGFGTGRPDAGGAGAMADGGGGVEPMPDAAIPTADAAEPMAVSLSQSQSQDVIGFTSVACFDDNTGIEQINSFYRVFDLAGEGITGPFEVTKVTFGVQECVSAGTGLPATVVLHTLEGDFAPGRNEFDLANLATPPLNSAETVIPDVAVPDEGQPGGILHTVPIRATVPAGARLVVELVHPGLDSNTQILFMGANRLPQSGLTYTRAAFCNVGNPTNADTLIDIDTGDPVVMHWVLLVEGTTGG